MEIGRFTFPNGAILAGANHEPKKAKNNLHMRDILEQIWHWHLLQRQMLMLP